MSEIRSPWYVEFFGRDYIQAYKHGFTDERASREVDFVERTLELKPGDRVRDLCCGQGRHAVLLARRGFLVTGQDLSAEYLELARESARAEGVTLELVRSDMRQIPFEEHFDAVINMFSAFGYLESEAEDLKVLQQAAKALKPGGRFLLDLINREWVVANNIPAEWRQEEDGTIYLERRELDLVTSRNHVSFTIIASDGTRRESVGHHMRLYTLTELVRMLAEAGLTFERAYGDFDGAPYGAAGRRMLVIGRKGEDSAE